MIFILPQFEILPTLSDKGLFGDMFGTINALFTGCALGGVIYTIFLQKTELTLQRKELKLTRQELKRSASAQEKSEKNLLKQVEMMKQTSKLNGLSALLNHYDSMSQQGASYDSPTLENANKTISNIKDLIDK